MAMVQKNFENALNLRYPAGLGNVVQGVQASLSKYDIPENVGWEIEDSVKGGSFIEKARMSAGNVSQHLASQCREKQDEHIEIKPKRRGHWWKLERIYSILSIFVSVFTLLISTAVPQNRESVWRDMDKF